MIIPKFFYSRNILPPQKKKKEEEARFNIPEYLMKNLLDIY
jgi:hypothetical protein